MSTSTSSEDDTISNQDGLDMINQHFLLDLQRTSNNGVLNESIGI